MSSYTKDPEFSINPRDLFLRFVIFAAVIALLVCLVIRCDPVTFSVPVGAADVEHDRVQHRLAESSAELEVLAQFSQRLTYSTNYHADQIWLIDNCCTSQQISARLRDEMRHLRALGFPLLEVPQ